MSVISRTPTARASILMRRTYNRPADSVHGENKEVFETWVETVDRTIRHQRWLWETAQGHSLTSLQRQELESLRQIQIDRLGLLSGRTLWLGGTDIAKSRCASQFNCAYTSLETVYDMVDLYWLLLQGTGVGFSTRVGSLFGFPRKIEIQTIRSKRKSRGGSDKNFESYDSETGVWTIRVGDSSEAWAKALGKLISHKHAGVKTLVLDFSQIRNKGARLSRYGWQSCGDERIHRAFVEIAGIMNRRADEMLCHQDIHDIANLCGTTLSNRRAAQISLFPFGAEGWRSFASCKIYRSRTWWRDMSNNSLVHYSRPTLEDIELQLASMAAAGGSEPGIVNAEAALKRAPWFAGLNPCAEILLANKGFCNLVTVNLSAEEHTSFVSLCHTVKIMARANYRQTCVDLRDGILQRAWHDNNQMLRLCGVSLSGIVQRPDITEDQWKQLRTIATESACGMADELGLPRPKNVTTVKPEGTASKIMGSFEDGETTPGVHNALGRYEFNTVLFGEDEPVVKVLRDAGYSIRPHPTQPGSVLVVFPVYNGENVPMVVKETAIDQLERYARMMDLWCDQNVSCTVYWTPPTFDEKMRITDDGELKEIARWIFKNWNSGRFVAVSFLPRYEDQDLDSTEQDVCERKGYPYLPVRVVSRIEYEEYARKVKPIDPGVLSGSFSMVDSVDDECASGACPVR